MLDGKANYCLSIIIPTYNEADNIGRLLEHIFSNAHPQNIQEILVVDGGSTDATAEIAQNYPKVQLIQSPQKGRPLQLNHGAQQATGDILYFLHADSFPPKDFDEQLIASVRQGYAGCFRLQFDAPFHWMLRWASWFTQFRGRLFRGGDQSLFITRSQYEALGGFDERYMIYEDIDFIIRLRKQFKFRVVNNFVTTSERKFRKNGVLRLYGHFLMIHILYRLGASPAILHQYYLSKVR